MLQNCGIIFDKYIAACNWWRLTLVTHGCCTDLPPAADGTWLRSRMATVPTYRLQLMAPASGHAWLLHQLALCSSWHLTPLTHGCYTDLPPAAHSTWLRSRMAAAPTCRLQLMAPDSGHAWLLHQLTDVKRTVHTQLTLMTQFSAQGWRTIYWLIC